MAKKTLSEILADMRLDLKDSGSLWWNADLTRCVEKAVSDHTRYLPFQKMYEHTLDFSVTDESWVAPAATSDTAIVNAVALNGKSDGATMTIADQTPDVPRPLKVTITDANNSISSCTVIIKGVDVDGNYREEAFYLAQGKVQYGEIYFKLVSQVELDHISGAGAGDTLSIGYGSHEGVWINLANKPIKPESDSNVDDGSTTSYTRGDDYEIDYQNGRIRLCTSSDISAGATSYIDYDKCKVSLDLSALIPDYIGLDRVRYPAKQIPFEYPSATPFGDILVIEGTADQSQMNLYEDNHIVIQYYAPHTVPSQDAPGSYKEFLEETIILAACGYALIMKGRQYEHAAVTDLASMKTELGLTTAIHTLVDTALDKIATYLTDNSNEDAKYWMTKLTTDIADLRTAIKTALDAANAFLDETDTTDFGAATDSAEGTLKTGEDLINTVPVGANAGAVYAQYAQAWAGLATARTNAALGYIQEASLRLNNLQSYINQAEGWMAIASGFAQEAAQRLSEIGLHLEEAAQYSYAVANDLQIADRFRAEGMLNLDEARAIWRDSTHYIGDFSYTSPMQPGSY